VPQAAFKQVNYPLDTLLQQIDLGVIGLPDIQRPFIWKPVKVRDLFDSMYQGFPVGYFLFWATVEGEFGKSIGMGGKAKVPNLLIVDGQQRLTSLYSVIKGKPVLRDDFTEYQIQIAFNPITQTFATADAAVKKDPEYIPDISALWTSGEGLFNFVTRFLQNLEQTRELAPVERDAIAENINRLSQLDKYPFTALELSAALGEDKVADIFVRINSQGITLNAADFILTLMSVYWEDGRRELETFSRAAKIPATSGASPFNYYLKPSPDQILRVGVGLAFFRGRLQHVYTLLRGKDMETGQQSEEIRQAQFGQLEEGQSRAVDLTNWHEFLKCLLAAGYASGDVISSENAILFTYTLYLIGKTRCSVDHSELRALVARWFFMAALTGRYTNSPESAIEQDLAKLRGKDTPAGFATVLQAEMDAALTNDYWEIQLPNSLATSAARSPSLFAFYAALKLLNANVLYSDLKVSELLDPAIKAKKSALERHHLFPRAYLQKSGVNSLQQVNQIANYALVEWADNIEISADPPSVYAPEYEQKVRDTGGLALLEEQYRLHAVPQSWYDLPYEEFCQARRKLMAATVRRAFESIGKAAQVQHVHHEPTIGELVALGESARIEFKSSARWNMKSGGKDPRLENKILATLAAFMNADGGTLIVGIDNNGAPVGLDGDYSLLKRQDNDGWRSWLTDHVSNGLGKLAAANLAVDSETLGHCDVVRIMARPSVKPVWVNADGLHAFYVRFDNSTRQLHGEEISDYLSLRWGEGTPNGQSAAVPPSQSVPEALLPDGSMSPVS
jgi:hypothetical protein